MSAKQQRQQREVIVSKIFIQISRVQIIISILLLSLSYGNWAPTKILPNDRCFGSSVLLYLYRMSSNKKQVIREIKINQFVNIRTSAKQQRRLREVIVSKIFRKIFRTAQQRTT